MESFMEFSWLEVESTYTPEEIPESKQSMQISWHLSSIFQATAGGIRNVQNWSQVLSELQSFSTEWFIN